MSAVSTVTDLLSLAGITVNGAKSYDIQVHNHAFYSRVLRQGTLGLGESYMDGWWDAVNPDEFLTKLLAANLQDKVRFSPTLLKAAASGIIRNQQTRLKARRNAAHHYNIGNDLFERMLDPRMIYSCGYWTDGVKDLAQAQTAKLDLICQKLQLKDGMTLLDIGCGWGGLARFAAERYGVRVTGISPAAEQVKVARERTRDLPVTIEQKDYREVEGTYDRIVSVGMLEHVGPKNFQAFFNTCQKSLNDKGLMLHHLICENKAVRTTDPWVDKYIFPGGVVPSLAQLIHATERKFIVEDVQNFGPYYDKTIMAWYRNFVDHYAELKATYDERFYRMWCFYLFAFAAMFRARHLQLYQIVMGPVVIGQTYRGIRERSYTFLPDEV